MIKLNYKRKHQDSQCNPILASFEKSKPNQELYDDLDFTVYEHSEPRKKTQQSMLCSSNNDKFEFVGKNLERQSGTRYMMGVMGDNGEMDLYDIDQSYSVQQHLKSDKDLGSIDSNIYKSGKNIWDLKRDLVSNLGTSKAGRKVKQMLSNIIDDDKISSKPQMSEFLKEKSVKLQSQLETQMEESKKDEVKSKRDFLPEFDINATEANKIYDINSIITREEFDSIKFEPIMMALKKQQKSKDSSDLPPLIKFFNEYTKFLVMNFEDSFSQITKYKCSTSYILKYIIYLDYLLKFISKKSFTKNSMEDVSKEVKIDMVFTKNILAKYYQATPLPENKILYLRSPLATDKLICHIIVLCLTMFGCKMDASYLSLVLKIDQKKIISYGKEVGCSVSIVENKNKKAKTPNSINMSLGVPFKLQPLKKPMKDKK